MKISTFIENYSEDKLKELKIEKYIPYLEKSARVRKILNACCFDEHGELNIKSNEIRILYILTIIDGWTSLDVDFTKYADEYDMLAKTGVLNKILGMIPFTEKEEFKEMLKLMKNDVLYNFGRSEVFISNQIKKMGMLLSSSLSPVLSDLNKTLSNISEKDIEKFGKKINSIVGGLKK